MLGIAISKQKLDRHSNMTPDARTNNGVLFLVPELNYGAALQPTSEADDLGQVELSA
jgi:hypothetical protein